MHNDSLETLLLRHYGNTAPTPSALEARLVASVRQEAELQSQGQTLPCTCVHIASIADVLCNLLLLLLPDWAC